MQIVFSLVVPVLNPSSALLTCLDSIAAQSCSLYEIIIVDCRNSISESLRDKLNHYAGIRYVSIHNYGVYAAMNEGLRLARGDWALFLGHDDCLYSREILEKTLNFIAICKCKPNAIYGDCLIRGFTRWAEDGCVYNGRFGYRKIFQQNICQQSIFYNVHACLGGPLMDDSFGVTGDWEFNIRLFLAKKFTYMPLIVAIFSAGGMSSRESSIKGCFVPSESFTFLINTLRVNRLNLIQAIPRALSIFLILRLSRVCGLLRGL